MSEYFDCVYDGETGEIHLEEVLRAEAYVRVIHAGYRVLREESWDEQLSEAEKSCYAGSRLPDLVIARDMQKEYRGWYNSNENTN